MSTIRTIATIAMQTPDGDTFTDYMVVDLDPRYGTWAALEHDASGQPFVYDTLREAEQALEEARAFDDYPVRCCGDALLLLTSPYRTV